MPARVLVLALLLAGALLARTAAAQATSDGSNGRVGTGASLGFAAVRPVADPSQACQHGADGLPGLPVLESGAPLCASGESQPTAAEQPSRPPPFTGGVFGPAGRKPDKRGPDRWPPS